MCFFFFHFFILCFPQKQIAYPYPPASWQDLQLFFQRLKDFLCPKEIHKGQEFLQWYLIPPILTLVRNALFP